MNLNGSDDLNDYEKKKQERIKRYRDRADKARAQSDALSSQAHDMLHVIPMGQTRRASSRSRKRIPARLDRRLQR